MTAPGRFIAFTEVVQGEPDKKRFVYFDSKDHFYVDHFRGERTVRWPFDDCPEGFRTPGLFPFRWSELKKLDRLTPIFIADTEEQANLIARMGLHATAVPGGLVWWPEGWGDSFFKDRILLVVTEDSERARTVFEGIHREATKHASSCMPVIIETAKDCDALTNWLQEPSAKPGLELRAQAALTRAKGGGIKFINPAGWANLDVPPRQWVWSDWIPMHQATLLTGAGASGKSLLGQQLATCVSLGFPFLGLGTRTCNALYITTEDDEDELHRRQRAICKVLNIPLEDLDDKLMLSSWHGVEGNALATFDNGGKLVPTSRYAQLREHALSHRVSFIVLDNKAHLFAGNENDRHQVAAFVNLLNQLATDVGGAVLFIAHPNKAGDEWSGSTAWEDQVRSRMFLSLPNDEAGDGGVTDVRVLRRGKSNYARVGEQIEFHWHNGAFARASDLPANEGALLAAKISADLEDKRFLECLEKATAQRRSVSPHSSESNFAPRVFQKMASAKGIKARGFEAAMHRLLDAGTIVGDQPLWQRENRTWVRGLGLHDTAH